MFRIALLVVSAFFSLFAAQADDKKMDLGPAVGSAIPHQLDSVDSEGKARSFENLVGDKGATVVFYRSAKWCPFCQKQLIGLKDIAKQAEDMGYPLVGVSYDEPKILSRFIKRRGLNYTLVSDKDSVIIDAFGIRNEDFKEGHYAYGVPHPLIAIVDKNGVIKAKLYEEGYKNRPQHEAILEALKEVSMK